MEYIENYLSIPVTSETESHISNYLRHAHYPHAIDQKRMKILVFNMPHIRMWTFAEKLGVSEWEYYTYPTPPEEYVNLFRFIDWHIGENLLTYRWNNLRDGAGVFSTMEERYRLFHDAYNCDGYKAWRLRYYLSKGLYGKIAESPRNFIGYEETDRRIECIEQNLALRLAHCVKDLDMPFYKQPITLDCYFDTDRFFIGWFICDDELLRLSGSCRNVLKPITAQMNPYLDELGLIRNTRRTDEVEANFNSQMLGGYQMPRMEQSQNPFFLNHVIIPWKNRVDEIPTCGYVPFVHLIDYQRQQILVFNMDYQRFCKLTEANHPISIHYSEGEPSIYKDLFNRIKEQMRANMPHLDDEQLRIRMRAAHFTGMSNYITRMKLYKGLRNLEP